MSQNREFEKYLQGKSGLTQLYADLPKIELPDHLDAAILAEAHRAVGARPGAKPKRRWAIPLSMVATLFLAVMIALQFPSLLKDAASPQQYKEEKIAALMDGNMAERSASESEQSKVVQKQAREKFEISRDEAATMPGETGAPARKNAPVFAAAKESEADENKYIGTTSVVAFPPVASPSPAPARAGERAAMPPESRESAGIASGMALSKEKKSSGKAAASVSDSLERQAPAVMMTAPKPVQLKRDLVQSVTVDENLPPDEWLVRIKRLKQEGKLDEARKELAAFIKRYPDHPVPIALEIK